MLGCGENVLFGPGPNLAATAAYTSADWEVR